MTNSLGHSKLTIMPSVFLLNPSITPNSHNMPLSFMFHLTNNLLQFLSSYIMVSFSSFTFIDSLLSRIYFYPFSMKWIFKNISFVIITEIILLIIILPITGNTVYFTQDRDKFSHSKTQLYIYITT